MAVARKFIDKDVLMNVIRHTDAHNKIQEEREMWKAYEQRKGSKSATGSTANSGSFAGKMRCDEDRSTYHMQELYNFEANDSTRWGHSGYHELYPEEFDGKDTGNTEGKPRKKKSKKDKGERKKAKKGKAKEKWKRVELEDVNQDRKRRKSERSKRKHPADKESESVKDNNRRKSDHKSRKRKRKDKRENSEVKKIQNTKNRVILK